MEPRASAPTRRLRTMERLARAGIPVGVSVSPLIPFINDPELERVLEQARDAGATTAFSTALRLPWEVNPLFQQWLQTHFPDRAARVMARIRDMRSGRDNDSRFGQRMTGTGVWAQLLSQRLGTASRRLGLDQQRIALDLTQFRRPSANAELQAAGVAVLMPADDARVSRANAASRDARRQLRPGRSRPSIVCGWGNALRARSGPAPRIKPKVTTVQSQHLAGTGCLPRSAK